MDPLYLPLSLMLKEKHITLSTMSNSTKNRYNYLNYKMSYTTLNARMGFVYMFEITKEEEEDVWLPVAAVQKIFLFWRPAVCPCNYCREFPTCRICSKLFCGFALLLARLSKSFAFLKSETKHTKNSSKKWEKGEGKGEKKA